LIRRKTMIQAVHETNFPELNLLKKGKVRDIYDLDEHFLMVATDRISAFDVVMPDAVAGKGIILTQISLFWFEAMKPLIKNHVVSSNVAEYPDICKPYADVLEGRSMIVKKAEPLSVECIVRGYISGSGWKSYQNDGTVCGIHLPQGLTESEQLDEPIFTPSTKEEIGLHDINISFEEAIEELGQPLAEKVKTLSLAIYKKGAELALEKGIIIADTKFEFGRIGEEIILIDEVLTPDSSRFWPKDDYAAGRPQKSFDKQYLRDYLNTLKWDKTPPGPPLPANVIENTRKKYEEALEILTAATHAA
jgi:phosphoribosylaminoimidazole-succinocarboxamide synthase